MSLVAIFPLITSTSPPVDPVGGYVATPTNAAYAGSAPGPAWQIGAGGTGVLRLSLASLAPPFTLACMFWPNGAPNNYTLMSSAPGDADYFDLVAISGTGGVTARVRSGATIIDVLNTTSFATGAWNNCALIATSSTSRTCYLNGNVATPDTTSIAPSGANNFMAIGGVDRDAHFLSQSADSQYLKWCAIFDTAMSGAALDAYFAAPASYLPTPPLTQVDKSQYPKQPLRSTQDGLIA